MDQINQSEAGKNLGIVSTIKEKFNKTENLLDKILVNIVLLYLFIPIEIFFIGFLRWYYSLVLTVIMIYVFCKISKSIKYKKIEINSKIKTILIISLILIWVAFSGIGGFSYQNDDYIVRNPVFNDLMSYDWPVHYNFENAPEEITDVVGNGEVSFSYYFIFWLPAALIGKVLGYGIAQICLYLWSALGIGLIVYLIKRATSINGILIILGMIMFSGMDVVGTLISKKEFGLGLHLEWWNTTFQYSSITTCLYWVFNQAIPIWIITSLILNLNNNKSNLAIGSLAFAYSPFAIFGMIPVMIISIFKKYEKEKKSFIIRIKETITSQNILIPIIIIIIFGAFFISSGDKITVNGWSFAGINSISGAINYIKKYMLSIFLEFGIYALLIFRERKKDLFYLTSIVLLTLIPLYIMTPANDFVMRGSMSLLFILMVEILYYLQYSKEIIKKYLLITLLVLGMITPFNEIYRSITNTVEQTNIIKKDTSFGILDKIDIENLALYDRQFFIHNYENTFFFKYLAK
ncbi:MAG: hypothetical protein Q4G05_02245 [Clostridia bacterium]|nr:hypothetical protein [Clostridia bacterium]